MCFFFSVVFIISEKEFTDQFSVTFTQLRSCYEWFFTCIRTIHSVPECVRVHACMRDSVCVHVCVCVYMCV